MNSAPVLPSQPIVERLRQFVAYGDTAEGRILAQLALTEIERLRSIAIERMDLFRQAASKVEQADTLLLAFVAAYQQQDADNFTDAMRNVYAAADLFVSGTPQSSDVAREARKP